jgi:hypothetical protein
MEESTMSNIIDIRDLIEEYEKLEQEIEAAKDDPENEVDDETTDRFKALTDLFDELRGCGGDEQWKGDWYPLTLIPESDFEDYARELAEDIEGTAIRDAHWPFTCIDWEKAAEELKQDYSSVEFDGVDYLYR